jgi:hypothetical protein
MGTFVLCLPYNFSYICSGEIICQNGKIMDEQQNNNGRGLKRIDLTKSSFMANGKEYFIEHGFSIERYCEYQILEKELAFGYTFSKLYEELTTIYNLMNKTKFVECAVMLHNITNGISKVSEREPTMLKLCALFINTADEDRTTVNADLIGRKLEDWKLEGYDVRDFFTLALNTLDGFINVYKKLTQDISQIQSVGV